MTVLLPTPFEHEDTDLAKSLGLLDGCDAFASFTEEELRLGDDMLNFDTDFLSLPSAFSTPPFQPAAPASDLMAQAPAAVVTPMVPLTELHSRQSLTPASSESWHPTASSDNSSDSGALASSTGADGAKKDPRIGKRKPVPNLDAIEDIQERRKQRRLAKNRATAAVSRERKRAQMATLSVRVQQLESDNANLNFLLNARDAELADLRKRLTAAGLPAQ